MYKPSFTITNPILRNIGAIEAAKEVIEHAPLLPYWEKKFRSHGYVPVDAIRRHVWDNKNVSFFYAQNILIYVQASNLSKYPGLEREVTSGQEHALPLVHPYMYLYYAERWRMVVPFLGKLPPSFLHMVKKLLGRVRRS